MILGNLFGYGQTKNYLGPEHSGREFFSRYVEPEFRGYDLGRIELKTCFDMEKKKGTEKICQKTKRKSTALLFLSAGMEVVGEKKVFE